MMIEFTVRPQPRRTIPPILRLIQGRSPGLASPTVWSSAPRSVKVISFTTGSCPFAPGGRRGKPVQGSIGRRAAAVIGQSPGRDATPGAVLKPSRGKVARGIATSRKPEDPPAQCLSRCHGPGHAGRTRSRPDKRTTPALPVPITHSARTGRKDVFVDGPNRLEPVSRSAGPIFIQNHAVFLIVRVAARWGGVVPTPREAFGRL